MKRNIVRLGHPALRLQAEPVDPGSLESDEMQSLIEELIETLAADPGSGLAATQVGAGHQILVLSPVEGGGGQSRSELVVINPLLELEHADLVYDWEACLSVPGLKGLVPRYPKVRLRGLNARGEPLDLTLDGLQARLVQHAYDHLNGVVFLDRMRDLKSLAFSEEWGLYLSDSSDAA
ncbi:MAG: peptide deformylase [Thermoanaerobaculia bacterium]